MTAQSYCQDNLAALLIRNKPECLDNGELGRFSNFT
jgi:hypothetical protein